MERNQNSASEYIKTYTSFSGCDIVATFGDQVIGELQGITYSVSREKAPIYTMGAADPRSFSRGKRGIAGTLVFTVFNREVLIEALKEHSKLQKFKANVNRDDENFSIDEWNQAMTGEIQDGSEGEDITSDLLQQDVEPHYSDEIPPFDITISFGNEYGQEATQVIYGVEILNEGSGYSIDSITTEKACTFVARKIDYIIGKTEQ